MCDNYVVDVYAASFGLCKCGAPKSAHSNSSSIGAGKISSERLSQWSRENGAAPNFEVSSFRSSVSEQALMARSRDTTLPESGNDMRASIGVFESPAFVPPPPPPPVEAQPQNDQPPPPPPPVEAQAQNDQPPPPPPPPPVEAQAQNDQPPPPPPPVEAQAQSDQPPPPAEVQAQNDQPPPPAEAQARNAQPPPPVEAQAKNDQPPPPAEAQAQNDQPPPPTEASPSPPTAPTPPPPTAEIEQTVPEVTPAPPPPTAPAPPPPTEIEQTIPPEVAAAPLPPTAPAPSPPTEIEKAVPPEVAAPPPPTAPAPSPPTEIEPTVPPEVAAAPLPPTAPAPSPPTESEPTVPPEVAAPPPPTADDAPAPLDVTPDSIPEPTQDTESNVVVNKEVSAVPSIRAPPPPPVPTIGRRKSQVEYEFVASEPWQISVGSGEAVTLLEDLGDGWCEVEKADGSKGLVPQTYLNLNQNVVLDDKVFGDDVVNDVPIPSSAATSDDDDEGMKMLQEAAQLAEAEKNANMKLKKVVMKSPLQKRRPTNMLGSRSGWKTRFFALDNSGVLEWSDCDTGEFIGAVDIMNAQVDGKALYGGGNDASLQSFTLTPMKANGKPMELKASTADEAREWMAAIKKHAKESDIDLRDSEVEFRDSTIRGSTAGAASGGGGGASNIRASQYKEDEEAAIFGDLQKRRPTNMFGSMSSNSGWKTRYCVLTGTVFSWKDSTTREMIGAVNVLNAKVEGKAALGHGDDMSYRTFLITPYAGLGKAMELKATSSNQAREWILALQKAAKGVVGKSVERRASSMPTQTPDKIY